ncbi:MAG TPA: hypothetical protein VN962_10835 [Polyangia bacterium]|nr:hypothetical protein [Polyangia bacterium]
MLRGGGTRLLVSAALLACAGSARAATLRLEAPDGCVDQATLEQEVADLVGRPLAQVPEADFRLTIAQQPSGRWHLKLEASEPGAAHVRELDAPSCSELGEAAAVAMAVSIRTFAETPPRPAPEPAPPVAVASVAASPPATVPPSRDQPHWRPALTLALTADTGDLPHTGPGVMAGAAVRRPAGRLAVTLGWMPSRDINLTSGPGGQFQLALVAADGCFAPAWGASTVLGCLGGELGAYWATGLEVKRPESKTTFWRAGRAGLGAALALSRAISLLVQGTAVVPWPRPGFVVDGATSVYRPDAVAFRIGAGLDFLF